MRSDFLSVLALALGVAAASTAPLGADEGLWLFNQVPRARIAQRYGFQMSDEFLDRLRLASVRFNNGGSGSFVSPEGLLFTNHHVGADCIFKLSSAENDYMANGFRARTRAEEKACPDLEVNVLLRIEDVTAKVKAAATPEMNDADANRARKAVSSSLESECTQKTGNRCDVVTLYSGGVYNLYEYKKYTDVRLVFAPEAAIAAFGGDPDNFTYPRYCLDFALFRAYENGQPARPQAYIPWSKTGAREGELVFVTGHPGTTGRLATMAQLEFYRDVQYPFVLNRLQRMIAVLQETGKESEEMRRVAADDLSSFQNSYKATSGFLRGLRDPQLMARKAEEERKLRALVEADAEKARRYGRIWDDIAAAYRNFATFYKRYALLESTSAVGSDLLFISRGLVRLAAERGKPNEQRLAEYGDARIPSLERELFSPAPIDSRLEIAELREYFQLLVDELGGHDPVVVQLLDGKTPAEAAAGYVNSSRIASDIELRKKLAASADVVQQSSDGMVKLASILDGPAREVRKRYEDEVEATLRSAAARIGEVKFSVSGTTEYPDATFTLRLSYAQVKGYRNDAGKAVPWATDFQGLYRRATGKEPFHLPPSWLAARRSIPLKTPFNFVSTADTHGGNSGSPTVNAKGEMVGILFDGNLEGLPNRFVFTDAQARSVHVASQGIVTALRVVYRAEEILKELGF